VAHDLQPPRVRWPLRVRLTIALVALGCAGITVVLGVRVAQVHEETGEWRLHPSAAPPELEFRGHDYRRDSSGRRLYPELVSHGPTPGGGQLYAPADDSTPFMIQVVVETEVTTYALVGSP
jgi:hypothetical protein